MAHQGLIHLYHGDGKGKTTAAFGLALRALGQGKKVAVVQFLKSRPSGEVLALEKCTDVLLLRGQAGSAFSIAMSPQEKAETKRIHDANLQTALDAIDSFDLLILDEALDAWQLGLLDDMRFRTLVQQKPAHLELVITGHSPEAWLVEKANYVTEMRKQKHPYESGHPARAGIEY